MSAHGDLQSRGGHFLFLPNKGTKLKICTVEGCDRKHKARWLCMKHYGAWYKEHGNQATRPPRKKPRREFEHMHTVDSSGCHTWSGAINSGGYGTYSPEGSRRTVSAHRYSYEKNVSPIPDGMWIDHTCFNRACVNPDHLRLATPSQNNQNLSGPRRSSSSGYRNVHKSRNGWIATIGNGETRKYGGVFRTPEEASVVAEQLRQQHFGEFAGKG